MVRDLTNLYKTSGLGPVLIWRKQVDGQSDVDIDPNAQVTVLAACSEECVIATKINTAVDKQTLERWITDAGFWIMEFARWNNKVSNSKWHTYTIYVQGIESEIYSSATFH